jgi:uncharacterized membrane protein YidH (DUF202 family)
VNRTFVLQEFKRTFLTWIPAGIALALLSVAAKPLLIRYVGPSDGENIINTVIACLIAGLGSGLGVTAFAKEFREGPLRLLENLPISRTQIWLVRSFFSLAAFVGIAGLLLIAHPSLLAKQSYVLPNAISIGMLLFTGGLYLGMIVSAPGAAVVLLNVLVAGSFSMVLLGLTIATASDQALAKDFAIYAAFWYVPGTVAGLFVFLYGEFDVKRRQFINRAVSTAVAIAAAVGILLTANSGVLARSESWQMAKNDTGPIWDISPDRRYVALVAQKDRHSLVTKAVVIDVESGKVAATLDQPAIHDLVWTTMGSALVSSNGSVAERLFGIGAGTGRITQVFPRVETIFKGNRTTISGGASTQGGTYFSVTSTDSLRRWKGKSSVLQLEGSGTKEILTTTFSLMDGGTSLYTVPNGVMFYSYRNQQSSKTWFIGPVVRDVSHYWGPFSAANREERTSIQQALLKSIPRLDGSKVKGVFIWSDIDFLFDEDTWIYYLQTDAAERTARLLARRKGDAQWSVAISEIPNTHAPHLLRGGDVQPASLFGLRVGSRDGLIVQAYRSGSEERIRLVNLINGERFDLSDKNAYEPGDQRQFDISRFGDHLEIIPGRMRKGRLAILPLRYAYEPGKGTPTPITAPITPRKSQTQKMTSGIQLREDSGVITTISPDGTTRRIWPQ